MLETIGDILLDTILDGAKIIPFLFLTYLLMEWIEHKTGDKAKNIVKKSGKLGPFFGGVLGAFPQCGFSASAATLYSARIITLGTLISVFLSTSDEMIPVLISKSAPVELILKILAIKIVLGMFFGFVIDLVFNIIRKKKKDKKEENKEDTITNMCKHDHCNCEGGILKSTIKHTLKTILFILLITLILNSIIEFIGEENVSDFIANVPFLGIAVSTLFGLIPNCAGSVIITELFIENMISFGALIAGLLVSSGIGILILYKNNKHLKQNILITLGLYIIGIISGLVIDLIV